MRELLGEAPLLYRGPVIARTAVPDDRIHLYLDVSGSMNWALPLLYGALRPLEQLLYEKVHLFSTEVHDISLPALRRGTVRSTGGTSIASVTAHMVAKRVRRALVLTDGRVGRVPEAHRDALRRRRVGVVLTAGGLSHFAREMGWRVARLPRLEETG